MPTPKKRPRKNLFLEHMKETHEDSYLRMLPHFKKNLRLEPAEVERILHAHGKEITPQRHDDTKQASAPPDRNKRPTSIPPMVPSCRRGESSSPPSSFIPHPSASSLVFLHDRAERPLQWLWHSRIPLHKVTLLIGDPDSGKSFLALDIAARVTRGEGVPPEPGLGQPGSVLLLCADDDLDDTILPRLKAAGADLSRIALLPSLVKGEDDDRGRLLSLSKDVTRLREALDDLPDCRLIVIDPISAYLQGVDGNNNINVRQILLELAALAQERQAAVLLISHQRKQWSATTLYRAIGSLAFTAVARVVLMLIEDPTTTGRRLLLPVKMTLQPTAPGRAFRIESWVRSPEQSCVRSPDRDTTPRPKVSRQPKSAPPASPSSSSSPKSEIPTLKSPSSFIPPPSAFLSWDPDEVPFTADEMLHLTKSGLAAVDRRREVATWLKKQLAHGPVPAPEMHRRAAEKSIPRRLLVEVRVKEKVEINFDGHKREWYWEIPKPWYHALVPHDDDEDDDKM